MERNFYDPHFNGCRKKLDLSRDFISPSSIFISATKIPAGFAAFYAAIVLRRSGVLS
jgi:hypothetical protein